MNGRAIRRLQQQRAKQLARHKLEEWITPVTDRSVGIHAQTTVPCSCWMCGNPRRFSGEVTRQEILADLKTTEEMKEQ